MLILILIGASLGHERPDTAVPELSGADLPPYQPWKPRISFGVV